MSEAATFEQMLKIKSIALGAVTRLKLTKEQARELIVSEPVLYETLRMIFVGQSEATISEGHISQTSTPDDVKKLLFRKSLADDEMSLFWNQREMARCLVEATNSPFQDSKVENIRIYLGQVLKSRQSMGKRNASNKLLIALPIAIGARISDPEQAKEVTDQIIEAIKGL